MTFVCDRCDSEVKKFGVTFGMSLDFEKNQPDDPARADSDRGHLCPECRDDFREWVAYAD